eukprot:COSAG02_NODE_174_length_31243_cov_76.084543_14_plen_35_part_00
MSAQIGGGEVGTGFRSDGAGKTGKVGLGQGAYAA